MIPVLLTLKGFYSYKKEYVIDFAKLTEGKLFGIFGSVGSGKSSILEAISFALYDQSERLNQKDKRSYNMMNLACDELLVDFVFTAGADEQLYRFKVATTRKKNKDEVNSFSRDTYIWKNNSWLAQSLKVEEVVGLSYENFRRTIIIPQGKFQEFLQLPDAERVKMMKEIFQLDRFDLSDRVNSLASKNKLQMENLEGQLIHLQEVDKDKLQELTLRTQLLSTEIENLLAEQNKAKEQEKILEQKKQVSLALAKDESRLNDLKKQADAMAAKEEQLLRYEKAMLGFSNLLNLNQELQQQWQDSETANIDFATNLAKLNLQIPNLKKETENAAIEYATRDAKNRSLVDLELLLKIKKLSNKEISLSDLSAIKAKELEEAKLEVKKWDEKEVDGLKKLDETKENLPDIEKLVYLKAWFEKRAGIIKNLEDLRKQHLEYEQKITGSSNEVVELLKKHIPNFKVEDLALQEGSTLVKSYLLSLEGKLETLTHTIDKQRAQERLQEFVQQLQDGKPCPLCGALEHPEVLTLENVELHVQKLQLQQSEISKALKNGQVLLQEVLGLENHKTLHNQLLIDLNQKTEIWENNYKAHESEHTWSEYKTLNEPEVEPLLSAAKAQVELVKRIQEGLEKVRKKQVEVRHLQEQVQAEYQESLQNFQQVKTEIGTLKSEIKQEALAQYNTYSEVQIIDEIHRLKAIIEKAELAFKKLEADLAKLIQSQNLLEGKLEAGRITSSHIQKRRDELLVDLATSLSNSEFENLEIVKAIIAQPLDLLKERNLLQQYQQEYFALEKNILLLKEQLGKELFDAQLLDNLKQEILKLENQLLSYRDEIAGLQTIIKTMKDDLALKAKLEKEINAVKLRGDNLKVLSNLFRANGFVNYISTKYLINLCNAANERFYKLSRQQLRLEVSENNDFLVRDFLNNGKTRSIKTLSGGQTFQAALCLALSLADSIQQLNKAENNFFFLDEGFGSQDKESLKLVFDALKSLRSENRIVGLISHVEELQQEIDVYLSVRNDAEEGSIVTRSWVS